MNTTAKPIVATTSLSLLLHTVAFAGLLLVYDQAIKLNEGVGSGVEIELISSVLVADQKELDVPYRSETRQELDPDALSEPMMHGAQKKLAENTLTSPVSRQTVLLAAPVDTDVVEKNNAEQQSAEQQHDIQPEQLSVDESESSSHTAQSTNASQQRHTILELLHSHISDNKEYPYLARRQRREGIATIAFVLHPDGKIENTHLLTSSRAAALDRAALSAVQRIAPFKPAQNYLEQAEEFRIDVVFNLL